MMGRVKELQQLGKEKKHKKGNSRTLASDHGLQSESEISDKPCSTTETNIPCLLYSDFLGGVEKGSRKQSNETLESH